MYKRLLIALSLLALAISAWGCGSSSESDTDVKKQEDKSSVEKQESDMNADELLSTYTELTAQPPSTEASPFPIEIVPGVAREQLGYLVFPGLIKNNSDKWIAVQLLVHLYDSAGQELTAAAATGNPLWASGLTFYIPPRGVSPFMGRADEQDIAGEAVSYKLTVHKAVESLKPVQIQASDVKVELGENFKVSGTLTNVGAEACPSAIAVAVGYAADGRVLLADFGSAEHEALDPGDSTPFEFEPLGEFETNKLITRGEVFGGCWPDSEIE